MNILRLSSVLALLGFVIPTFGCGSAPPAPPPTPSPAHADQDVADAERAFAATMAKRDFAAFGTFVSDEALFVSDGRTLRGKTQVVEAWKRFFEKPAAPFSWEPTRVEVLDSGALALSTGPVRTPDGQIVATFTSIWRKEPSGWHILFDRGVDFPECPAPVVSGKTNSGETPVDFAAYKKHLTDSLAAYGRKDYAGFLAATLQASGALPQSPRAMYNIACGQALTGQSTDALAMLEKLARMRISFDVTRDDDLASLRNLPEFATVRDKFAALEKEVIGKSETGFTLPARDTIPEGIAYDAKTRAFFVSSVHNRKILRISGDGKAKDFATKDLYAVLGLAVDESRRRLWACSSAVPEMKGFDDRDKGRANLVEFDIDTGKVRQTVALGNAGENHNCNDLTLDRDGRLFVSDPGASTLWTLPAGGKSLEVFLPAEKLASPQGITLDGDGKSLFLADYSRGLFHVDTTTRELTWLRPPENATLLGLDGLISYHGDLIAIQNGVRPHRVVRIAVDPRRKSVSRVEVLQMNHPAFNEPTLGVVVGRDLFYVANSQWGSFDKGVIWPMEKLREPVILKLGLE